MSDENRKPPETEEDVFNVFVDLFDEAAPETQEEVDEFLRENGYDPNELVKNATGIFQEAFEIKDLVIKDMR